MQARESAKASITENCTTGCAVKCGLSTIAKMSLASPIGASWAVETTGLLSLWLTHLHNESSDCKQISPKYNLHFCSLPANEIELALGKNGDGNQKKKTRYLQVFNVQNINKYFRESE